MGAMDRPVSEHSVWSLCWVSGPVHTLTPGTKQHRHEIRPEHLETLDKNAEDELLVIQAKTPGTEAWSHFDCSLCGERVSQQQEAAPNWGHNIYEKPKVVLSNWKGDMGSGERATFHTSQLQTLLLLSSPAWALGR